MKVNEKEIKLTPQQQRVMLLLFKFRFVSAQLLAQVMDIRRESVYQVLEYLVKNDLVTKVYKNEYRIRGKPAYYYLNKTGVTTLRKLMEVKEAVVHALYKNDKATEEFIDHNLSLAQLYISLVASLPQGTEIFTRTEINRFTQFPKNRPDLYLRTPDGKEAIVILVDEKPLYIVRKRLDEIIRHNEEEGWDGAYPYICFVLKDIHAKNSFLYVAHKKIVDMGFEECEMYVLATTMQAVKNGQKAIWSNVLRPKVNTDLLE